MAWKLNFAFSWAKIKLLKKKHILQMSWHIQKYFSDIKKIIDNLLDDLNLYPRQMISI